MRGLDGNPERTLEDVGAIFNITRERVRQLQNLALNKMRRIFREREQQRSQEEIAKDRASKGRRDVMREFIRKNAAKRREA